MKVSEVMKVMKPCVASSSSSSSSLYMSPTKKKYLLASSFILADETWPPWANSGWKSWSWHMWPTTRWSHWSVWPDRFSSRRTYNFASHVIQSTPRLKWKLGCMCWPGPRQMHLSETNESGLNLTSSLQNSASSLFALHDGSAPLSLGNLSKNPTEKIYI